MAEKAKLEVSKTTGISADRLSVANKATLANTEITRFKLIDTQGNIYGISLDAAGNQISQEVLDQAVQAINNKGFVGKLEAELANRIGQGSNSPIRVVFYLKGKTVKPYRGSNRTEYQNYFSTLKSHYEAIQQPLVKQLKESNQRVIYQSLYTPMVVAEVTPLLIQTIAARSDVERIYLERRRIPRQNVSRVVVQANTVNTRGLTGVAETVAVVETGRIGTHPNLPALQRTLCRPTASTFNDAHKTQVAGVIQSTAASVRGIAPDITIVDGIMANDSDAESMAAIECVINSASATNISYGFETNGSFDSLSRYMDEIIYNTGATIVIAATNVCANKMGSPEIAFNVIAVGSFGDNNTTTFADDIAACTGVVTASSYLNPDSPNGDREEPDVVAPGHQITMPTNGGGFVTTNGNSYAAPHVTAGAGLLRARKTELFNRPAEVRAIMMASARHNIEGDSRLSDRDGDLEASC
ncbi:S8 family serine peptidase [Nostoc sp.]|uniref:S8 family serine peptidase n=1 Tax=Nostoc sp. TaxID=1180 RepID=UPI002FF5A4C3